MSRRESGLEIQDVKGCLYVHGRLGAKTEEFWACTDAR